jgi:hypothetical protein
MILLPIGYAVALGLLLWRGDDRLRSMAIAAAALAVLLLLATLYFSLRYNVYALAQFGERRLFDYAGVPMLMLAAGVLEVALLELARVRIGGSARGWLAPAAAALVFVVAAVALLPKDRLNAGSERFLTTALGPLSWIERNVPCDGRILADRRTLATFQVYTRHAGVLEGMGPYLRPDVLSTAIREMLAARQFFLDPAAHESYLRDNGIWGVVVTAPSDPLGGALKVAQLNRTGLDSAPFLQVVTQSPTLTVYRYTGYDPAAAARFPSVVDRPGFECGAR